MEADKARRRVLYWWRDTPQYLQILRWTGYSETLVCSVQLMLRAGWKGLSGDRKFLRGNTRCENGVQGLCLPATILSASSLTSFSLFVPDIVGPPVHPHMVWPSPIPSCTVSSCTSSDNEGSLNCCFIPARVLVLSICFFGSQCSKEQPVYLWLTLSSSWTALGFQQKDWKNKEKGSFNLPWGIVHFSNTDNLKNTKHYANTLVTLKNKIKSFVVRK